MFTFPPAEFFIGLGSAIVAVFLGAYGTWRMFGPKILALMEKENITDADIGNPDFAKHRVIHENITILRSEMSADRVQVGQFHNGGKFLDGSPMKKFSISHESCAAGVSFEFQNLQAVQATIFCDLIELMKKDLPVIYLTNSLPEDSSVKTYNRSKGIEAFSVLPIRKRELYIGFVRVEWADLTSLPTVESEFGTQFKQYRSYIELEINKKG